MAPGGETADRADKTARSRGMLITLAAGTAFWATVAAVVAQVAH